MQDEIKENNLRQYREMVKYSQADLAIACGVNVDTILNIENNKHTPMWATQRNIFAALVKLGAENKDGTALKIKDVFPE